MRSIALSLVLVAGPAFADCPPVQDTSDQLSALIARAQTAETEAVGQAAGQEMWQIWAKAPDAVAQEMLDRGMAARASFDYLGALQAFDDLVAYCPDYAEGYNQRAFVNYLRQNYEPALADLNRALERSPRHVAALAGKGLTLLGLGREDEAQDALKAAVALNPWLSERHLIKEPEGTDL